MNEIQQILILSGINPLDINVEPEVTEIETPMDNFSDISQLRLLADSLGLNLVITLEEPVTDIEIDNFDVDVMDCDVCGNPLDSHEVPCVVSEGNSEFDIANNPAKPNGEDGEIHGYQITDNQANLKTKYVPARSGDNPLCGPEGVSIVEKSFRDYLDKIIG